MTAPPNTLDRLRELQELIRSDLCRALAEQRDAQLAEVARDEAGDTIFAIDVAAEQRLLPYLEDWARDCCFRLLCEGLEPEGRVLGKGEPAFVLILDPVDGSRGLMFDKRPAWSLAAVAPERGADTRLSEITHAAMTELPHSRQASSDQLFAERGAPSEGSRQDLRSGTRRSLPIRPSRAQSLKHGFATVCDYFPGGKQQLAAIAERLFQEELGGWNPDKAEIYSDQYISSGGMLAELCLGRDRFVLDCRPQVYASLGIRSGLCSKPYDLCCALIAAQAGVVVRDPLGGPLDAPLDLETNVSFVAYANQGLSERLGPRVAAALREVL